MPHASTLAGIGSMYAHSLAERSHGEGFLDFFLSRLRPEGLYLLDEPEGALSYERQLSLAAAMMRAEAENCQFVLCTHSPVLAAYPGAQILEIADGSLAEKEYDALGSVAFLRGFLRAPGRIMDALSED